MRYFILYLFTINMKIKNKNKNNKKWGPQVQN